MVTSVLYSSPGVGVFCVCFPGYGLSVLGCLVVCCVLSILCVLCSLCFLGVICLLGVLWVLCFLLVAAWGVPAVSNAVLPKPVSKGTDTVLRKIGLDHNRVTQRLSTEISKGVGNFTNGVVSYSGAPMTYSPQYESFQGKDYEGPGWNPRKAFESGLKETVKGGASSSQPVESLKSVSFEAKPVSGGVDYAGMARDSAMLTTGASGVEVSAASIYQHEKGTSDE